MIYEIYKVSLKSIISVSVLFVLTKIMVKKQISQLTLFDYVVGISIGSITYINGIVSMIIYALF